MLHSAAIIAVVSETLQKFAAQNIVLDPVMVATSGDSLFQNEALEALKSKLIPISTLITPNLPEAESLWGRPVVTIEDMRQAAISLSLDGKVSVLIKGGHLADTNRLCDVLFDANTCQLEELYSDKVETENTHGTGCTLSSAIATWLAQGHGVTDAVKRAKQYISGAIEAGSHYEIGGGHGPVHHFYQLNKS